MLMKGVTKNYEEGCLMMIDSDCHRKGYNRLVSENNVIGILCLIKTELASLILIHYKNQHYE